MRGYMSFCDAETGKFKGACYVEFEQPKSKDTKVVMRAMIDTSWEKGCNPGGQVMAIFPEDPETEEILAAVPMAYMDRLLQRPELEEVDRLTKEKLGEDILHEVTVIDHKNDEYVDARWKLGD